MGNLHSPPPPQNCRHYSTIFSRGRNYCKVFHNIFTRYYSKTKFIQKALLIPVHIDELRSSVSSFETVKKLQTKSIFQITILKRAFRKNPRFYLLLSKSVLVTKCLEAVNGRILPVTRTVTNAA